MLLGDLLASDSLDVSLRNIEVGRVEIDSRACGPNTLFFALPGLVLNGASFIEDAARRGAVVAVAAESVEASIPVIVVPATQLRGLVAHASASVVGNPQNSMELIGVTGTNGKSSVTTLVTSICENLGWNAANIGTLTNVRTTPAAPELFRTLAGFVEHFDAARDRSVVSLEVSSHALDQHRVEGLLFEVAAFTNLSHDHLDYHGTMEAYFQAKASLFRGEHAKHAVIWTDDPYGERLANLTTLPVTRVRRAAASDVRTTLGGTSFTWRQQHVQSSLVGDYNVDNALMAMEIVRTLGVDDTRIASAMSKVRGVAGRFEVVNDSDPVVIVDYAHTPEGLRRLLQDVREFLHPQRVITVFGCGGDRDREKRPHMGEVVSRISEITIVTSDNPRTEPPDAIIDSIIAGTVPGAKVLRIRDRREAIGQALHLAGPGDVVVLAGKGHETTQTIGDEVLAFDDRAVARELLR